MVTYYMQLKPIVIGYLEGYQNDFLVHDKKVFRKRPKTFFMGIRKTGTNTMCDYQIDQLINGVYEEEMENYAYADSSVREYCLRKGLEYAIINFRSWIIGGSNDRFFHEQDGDVIEVSRKLLKTHFCAYLIKFCNENYPATYNTYHAHIIRQFGED